MALLVKVSVKYTREYTSADGCCTVADGLPDRRGKPGEGVGRGRVPDLQQIAGTEAEGSSCGS